jgi:uncharacterized protein YyaL (SSP411 family)
LEDYALFIRALIRLYEVTAEKRYLLTAKKLTGYVMNYFSSVVSVHNVRLLRYARQKNAHLPHVNSAFFDFASLASEHYDSDTDFIDGL